MPTNLEVSLSRLGQYRQQHTELASRVLQGPGVPGYPLDFLALAALHRSGNLHSGFTMLFQAKNFISAAPLVRLQLDNCLRFYAAFLVADPQQLSLNVFGGKPIRKMKSRDGERMTDAYLVSELSRHHPWISDVYEHSSGYIHLSDSHFHNTVKMKDGEANIIQIKVGFGGEDVPESIYADAINAFCDATDVFFAFIAEWVRTKVGSMQGTGEDSPEPSFPLHENES